MAVDIMALLRSVVAVNGSQKETARVLCISPQYLCDLLAGRREVSAEVAESLGCERIVTYIDRLGGGNRQPPLDAVAKGAAYCESAPRESGISSQPPTRV